MSNGLSRLIRTETNGLSLAQAGREGSVTVHQNVEVWAARFASGAQATFGLKPSRHAFAHVARGAVTFNRTTLNAGDGAAVSEEEILEVRAVEAAELLLFDLA